MNPDNAFKPKAGHPADAGSAPEADVRRAARQWIAQRDAGLSSAEKRQFRDWLAADPRNASALAEADSAGSELDWPFHADAVDDVLTGLDDRARRRRQRRRIGVGLSAAAILTVVLWRAMPPPAGAHDPQMTSNLAVVEPRRQTLPDGSSVEFQDDAQIAVVFNESERRVELSRGTAYFDVASDPQRPFIVNAAGYAVRAVGTAFSVELRDTAVSVLVTEGRVSVDAKEKEVVKTDLENPKTDDRVQRLEGTAPSPGTNSGILVKSGYSVVLRIAPAIAAGGSAEAEQRPVVQAVAEADLNGRLGWRIPRLEFSGTPLTEIVTIFNRHNRVQFVVADPSMAGLKISGLLRADRVEALVELLETEFAVRAERGEGTILLRRSTR